MKYIVFGITNNKGEDNKFLAQKEVYKLIDTHKTPAALIEAMQNSNTPVSVYADEIFMLHARVKKLKGFHEKDRVYYAIGLDDQTTKFEGAEFLSVETFPSDGSCRIPINYNLTKVQHSFTVAIVDDAEDSPLFNSLISKSTHSPISYQVGDEVVGVTFKKTDILRTHVAHGYLVACDISNPNVKESTDQWLKANKLPGQFVALTTTKEGPTGAVKDSEIRAIAEKHQCEHISKYDLPNLTADTLMQKFVEKLFRFRNPRLAQLNDMITKKSFERSFLAEVFLSAFFSPDEKITSAAKAFKMVITQQAPLFTLDSHLPVLNSQPLKDLYQSFKNSDDYKTLKRNEDAVVRSVATTHPTWDNEQSDLWQKSEESPRGFI